MDGGVGREENRSLYSNSGALRVEIICRHTVRTTLGGKKQNKTGQRPHPTRRNPEKSEERSTNQASAGCQDQLTLLRWRVTQFICRSDLAIGLI